MTSDGFSAFFYRTLFLGVLVGGLTAGGAVAYFHHEKAKPPPPPRKEPSPEAWCAKHRITPITISHVGWRTYVTYLDNTGVVHAITLNCSEEPCVLYDGYQAHPTVQ